MTHIALENNNYLNVEVTGSLDLPKVIFSNKLFGKNFGNSTILKFFPDSLFACKVYLPSTNK